MQSAQAKTDYKQRPARTLPQPRKRVVKMDGNVAYVSNGFAKRKVQQPTVSAKKRPKPRLRTGLASTITVLFIAFSALALLVSRYAVVCSIGSKNNELERQLQVIKAQTDSLAVQMELKDNIQSVHTSAQSELGMTYPGQNQRITINLDG